MCDIIVALPDATARGRVLFGKNSDRPAGECQVWYDSQGEKRPLPGRIRGAFVEVPEAGPPLRTRGCRPYWCWGYETGMNEAGVVGGNTATYSRAFHLPENRRALGLTGMELLRLGLERGRSAAETVAVIVDLLAAYGQWAPAVPGRKPADACYENAFMIADRGEAWLLETAGRRWAARCLKDGVHALSNQLTIREAWTTASDDLADHAEERGWWSHRDGPFDFALACSDHEHQARQVSHVRWQRSRQLLRASAGRIAAGTMMAILRDHYEGTFLDGPMFGPHLPDLLTLCMHDSPAAFTWGNTATSVIVDIDPAVPESSMCWSCYQPPCSSVYVATTMGGELSPQLGAAGTAGLRSESPMTAPPDAYRAESLWWRLYRLLGAIAQSPAERRAAVRAHFDPIEQKALLEVDALEGTGGTERAARVAHITMTQLSGVDRALGRLEREWKLGAG